MDRQEFINYFKDIIKKDSQIYFSDFFYTLNFQYLLDDIDNDGHLGLLHANSKLNEIYQDLNISKHYYLKKSDIHIEYDWDYNEENPDSDFCSYNSSINLNNLYDNLILNECIKSDKYIDIYRIEESTGGGLYNGVGYKIVLDAPEKNQPGPNEEVKFFDIFSNTNHVSNDNYKKGWNFAFKDFAQIKTWLDNSNILLKLKEKNFILKKITINENLAIIGDYQVIYRKEGIVNIENLSLDVLDSTFNNKKVQKKAPSI